MITTAEYYDGRVNQGVLEQAQRSISVWRILCLAVVVIATAAIFADFLLGTEITQQQQIIEQLRQKCIMLQKDAETIPQIHASHLRIRRENTMSQSLVPTRSGPGTEERKFYLTPDELRQRGSDLARCYQKLGELQVAKAEATAAIKAEVTIQERAVERLSAAINNGYEYRTVDLQDKMFPEEVVEQVVDRVVDQINDGAIGEGITATKKSRRANA